MSSYSLPFGKHKGKPLSAVPESYLKRILNNSDFSISLQLRANIQSNLQNRNIQTGCSPTKKKRAYKKGRRRGSERRK
jgi:hypothetical protein